MPWQPVIIGYLVVGLIYATWLTWVARTALDRAHPTRRKLIIALLVQNFVLAALVWPYSAYRVIRRKVEARRP